MEAGNKGTLTDEAAKGTKTRRQDDIEVSSGSSGVSGKSIDKPGDCTRVNAAKLISFKQHPIIGKGKGKGNLKQKQRDQGKRKNQQSDRANLLRKRRWLIYQLTNFFLASSFQPCDDDDPVTTPP